MSDESWLHTSEEAMATPFTVESLQQAFDHIANAPIEVCGVTYPHVVHPKSDGITRCGNCFNIVKVRDTSEGKVVEW